MSYDRKSKLEFVYINSDSALEVGSLVFVNDVDFCEFVNHCEDLRH